MANKSDIQEYVNTLSEPLARLYKQIAEAFLLTAHDTLSDDFQIVCELQEVFDKRASVNKDIFEIRVIVET